MPEAPEVAIFTDYFRPLEGLSIYKILYAPHFTDIDGLTLPLKINKITSYGKKGLIFVEGGVFVLSFGMTGKLLPYMTTENNPCFFYCGTLFGKNKEKQSVIHEKLICYTDVRGIGGNVQFSKNFSTKIPEVLHNPLDEKKFVELFSALTTKRKIAAVLLDQKIIMGIGNYLRAEILNDAGINPATPTNALTDGQLSVLYFSTKKIVLAAYKAGGTTISTYANPDGKKGGYVCLTYQCDTCSKCQGKIVYGNFGDGRKTFYCEICQK